MYIPFLWVLAWRFFTGLHLDGKNRQSKSGAVLPRFTNYYWNRYSRLKRAIWRNLILWAMLGFCYGVLFDRSITIFYGLAFAPFLVYAIGRKSLDAITQVTQYQDSDGVTEKYRVIRPQIRRWFASLKPSKFRVKLPDGGPVPPDIARAIQAGNAEEGGEPILNLRMLESFAEGENDVTQAAVTGRARTIARKKRKAS